MNQKETSNEIYDISALLDEELGKEGTPERERNRERAWEEYNAQILMDARKNAHLTQARTDSDGCPEERTPHTG